MIELVTLSIFAISIDASVHRANANSSGSQPIEMAVSLSSRDGENAVMTRAVSSATESGTEPLPERRGQPRVSKTRCAFVTCVPQCDIKGTRESNGDLVYRTPSSPLYGLAAADRMFCSQADATAAGYREDKQG
jgi:hypothetical protein